MMKSGLFQLMVWQKNKKRLISVRLNRNGDTAFLLEERFYYFRRPTNFSCSSFIRRMNCSLSESILVIFLTFVSLLKNRFTFRLL